MRVGGGGGVDVVGVDVGGGGGVHDVGRLLMLLMLVAVWC